MQLDSSRAIAITGASRGIGAAVAEAIARKGVRLALLARSSEKLAEVNRRVIQLGAGDSFATTGDVGNSEVTQQWMRAILDRYGRIDALINNAGLGIMKSVEHMTDDDWRRVIDTNLVGPFRLMRAVIEPMRAQGGGHIVNVSSIAGEVAFATGGAYCASKFGLQGLSECLMGEVRRDGIKVSIVCPGSVNTRFDSEGADVSWKIAPEEIARTIVYLLEAPDNAMASKIHVRPTLQGKK
jgi:NADP-dependent 3-hydroxy acid dehydrogenase YdfG